MLLLRRVVLPRVVFPIWGIALLRTRAFRQHNASSGTLRSSTRKRLPTLTLSRRRSVRLDSLNRSLLLGERFPFPPHRASAVRGEVYRASLTSFDPGSP